MCGVVAGGAYAEELVVDASIVYVHHRDCDSRVWEQYLWMMSSLFFSSAHLVLLNLSVSTRNLPTTCTSDPDSWAALRQALSIPDNLGVLFVVVALTVAYSVLLVRCGAASRQMNGRHLFVWQYNYLHCLLFLPSQRSRAILCRERRLSKYSILQICNDSFQALKTEKW